MESFNADKSSIARSDIISGLRYSHFKLSINVISAHSFFSPSAYCQNHDEERTQGVFTSQLANHNTALYLDHRAELLLQRQFSKKRKEMQNIRLRLQSQFIFL